MKNFTKKFLWITGLLLLFALIATLITYPIRGKETFISLFSTALLAEICLLVILILYAFVFSILVILIDYVTDTWNTWENRTFIGILSSLILPVIVTLTYLGISLTFGLDAFKNNSNLIYSIPLFVFGMETGIVLGVWIIAYVFNKSK